MKKTLKYIFFILLAGVIGGYIYWQQNKKRIIRQTIQDAVNKNTDSLYYIHYDSSRIDEINGNATFYNVSLQSDSAQKELLKRTDSLPNALFIIKVDEIKATNIDVAGLLQNENVKAKKILLTKPFIQIINTGTDKPKVYTARDTLELYKKILGSMKSIEADTIQVTNGTVIITNIAGKPLTTLENINITLNNFLIDSSRNYNNIISYFIKDVRATVENIQLPPAENNTRVNLGKMDYDAVKKTLKIGTVQQYKINETKPVIDLKNILLTGLSTDSLILYHQFRAATITCDGGLITIYKKDKSKEDKNNSIDLSSELIDEVRVGTAKLGNTKIVILNTSRPQDEPFILNDVRFEVSKVFKVTDGSTLANLINNAEWKLYSSGFSMYTNDKLYKLAATGISVDNKNSSATIGNFALVPLLSEEAFMRQRTIQGDRFDMNFANIQLQGIDIAKLFVNNEINVQNATIRPVLKVYNDRTLAYDTRSKVGAYPYQALMKLKTPIYIKQLTLKNGAITYKEKGRISEATGNVYFNNINAVINNVTNMPEKISIAPDCKVHLTALFLGAGKLNADWRLPLTAGNGNFNITGQLGPMDATLLNPVSEPLGMVSIKHGSINNLKFNLTGNDLNATVKTAFLYSNLGIKALKKDGDETKTKDVASFLFNFLTKNNNPQGGKTRTGDIEYKRDITKSFFYLLWKSVFSGAKKIASGS